MKTLGLAAVISLVGWVALVLLLNNLLPGTDEMTRALRGGLYLAYIVLAVAFVVRSRGGQQAGNK